MNISNVKKLTLHFITYIKVVAVNNLKQMVKMGTGTGLAITANMN